MIKVLWLSPTPCGAIEKISPNIVTGGWMQSLEEEMVKNPEIELHVAFYTGVKLEAFKYKSTYYHPLFRKNTGSKLQRLFNRALPDKNKDKRELDEIYKIVQTINPDIIHVHGTEDNWGMIQKYTTIPTVVSIQGLLLPISEKYFSGIPKWDVFWNEGIISKLLFNSVLLSYRKMKKSEDREQEILRLSRNIIGRTDWDRRITRVLAPDSEYFVGNEMLRSIFYNARWEKKEFSPKLRIVSSCSNGVYKGLETIVKTATVLNKYGILFEWIVIGQKDSDMYAKMIQRYSKCNYEILNIKFIGSKNAEEVAEVLLESDIFCQVSHIENSSNSLCEAMILGLPIVATFAGGTDSMLENRKEGILVQDGDPYSMAGAIITLVINSEIAKEYSKNAREKAQVRHNKLMIVNSLLNIYLSVLGSDTSKI